MGSGIGILFTISWSEWPRGSVQEFLSFIPIPYIAGSCPSAGEIFLWRFLMNSTECNVVWLSPSERGGFTGTFREVRCVLAFLHLRQPASLLHLGKRGFR